MSIFSAFSNKIKTATEAFGSADITSEAMKQAIAEWFNLYYNQEPSKDEDPCQQIPYTIVRKITKTAFSEYKTESKDEYARLILGSVSTWKEEATQKALIGGECFLKPVPTKTGWKWAIIDRQNMMVFGRDTDGNITDLGTAEVTVQDKWIYTLLERRTVTNGYMTIKNTLYRSDNNSTIGTPVPLSALEKYAELPDEYTFTEPFGSIGLVPLKTPIENNIDGSKDGVSVYSAAVGLINNINRNEALLNGEFERGQSRVFVSDDLTKNKNGKRELADNLFTTIDGGPDEVGITIFSPELRDEAHARRRQAYLRTAENIIGLKRGLLSEVEAVERTAKEITSTEGDYNLTIIDFQNMWTKAVAEAVRVCGILGRLYNIPGAHDIAEDAYSIDWGNGVLYDEEKTWADYQSMVSSGLLKPEIALGWRFNMPTETEADLAAIRQKFMPDMPEVD